MQRRRLGIQGLSVSTIGLGCMGMTEGSGSAAGPQARATLHRALDLGVNLLDTADVYGPFRNEKFIGEVIANRRQEVVIATKFGIETGNNPGYRRINGHPRYVKAACEGSLKRLGVDHIDVYCLHRVDPKVPIEETVGAMARLVETGKVRYLGLSEAAPQTVRRAHIVHPMSVVQNEYSLWSREPEQTLLSCLRELQVGLLAYSPLGRGFLAGGIKGADDLTHGDYRRHWPRFRDGNVEKNVHLVQQLDAIAHSKNITLSQLALAWVLAQGEDVVALTGTKRVAHLNENVHSVAVELSESELEEINTIMPLDIAEGGRYPPVMMQTLGL